jgi:hypothetical protein
MGKAGAYPNEGKIGNNLTEALAEVHGRLARRQG